MASPITRTRLLDAGRQLMLSRGYGATAIDDICDAAGVSKGSFYHFFSNKESYGLAVLDRFYKDGVARVRSGGFLAVQDPRERLEAFLDHLETVAPGFWEHGCLMGTFAAELSESSPAIRARVGQMFDELVAMVAPLFLPVVGDAGEAAALAEEMLVMIEGSIIIARAHDDPGRIATGLRRFRRGLAARLQPSGEVAPP